MTTAAKGTAVTKKPEDITTAIAPAELQAQIAAYTGGGVDDMSQMDQITPFLALIQGLSPQVDKQKPQYLPDADVGDIFNSVTGEVFKNEEGGLLVIPVVWQKVFNAWVPRDLGGGFLGSYADPELTQPIFVPPNAQNEDQAVQIVETANWFVLAQGKDGLWAPAIISMKSTQLKASRQWATLTTIAAQKNKTKALFVKQYRITSVSQTNEKGTFANYKITDVGYVTPEQWHLAEQFRDAVKGGLVKIDPTKAQAADAEVEQVDDKDLKY